MSNSFEEATTELAMAKQTIAALEMSLQKSRERRMFFLEHAARLGQCRDRWWRRCMEARYDAREANQRAVRSSEMNLLEVVRSLPDFQAALEQYPAFKSLVGRMSKAHDDYMNTLIAEEEAQEP